jgi:hypothetical protein
MHSNYTDTMTPHCELRRLMEIQVIADQSIKRRKSSKIPPLDPTASATTHLRDHPREYATTAQTIQGWADHKNPTQPTVTRNAWSCGTGKPATIPAFQPQPKQAAHSTSADAHATA